MEHPPHQSLFIGIVGSVGSLALSQVSTVIGIGVGLLTGVAMTLRLCREWRALREERERCRACRERALNKGD